MSTIQVDQIDSAKRGSHDNPRDSSAAPLPDQLSEFALSRKPNSFMSRRNKAIMAAVVTFLGLIAVVVAGQLLGGQEALATDLPNRNQPPSLANPFGTDRMGRDMLLRTLLALRTSLMIGVFSAAVSACLGLIVGVVAAVGGPWGDRILAWLIDLVMALPHLIVLILIAFVTGGGIRGVAIAIAATHWTGLARIIRAEVIELRERTFVHVARRLGKSRIAIAREHIIPHVIPQFIVGIILMFPHAILHESALSFIGIGMAPDKPAVGVILAESLRALAAGHWWLTVLPGLALLIVVILFDIFGEQIRSLINPKTSHE